MVDIRSATVLPARREEIELHTSDGLTLVGELALPLDRDPKATLVTLHPLPPGGGFMDSHVIRKASNRLPAMADLAVLRFNTRGTSSPRGTSEGYFDEGIGERLDVAAAMDFVAQHNLPSPWLLGWSFGTELTLKYGLDHTILGAILLSPPLHRTSVEELERWAQTGTEVHALIPEFDDYLRPDEAAARFAVIPQINLINVAEAKHLWVGEKFTYRVLDEIVKIVNPEKSPLPTEWPAPTA